ncbi:NAD(P)-dependent glycerol-1-phosphate dehydrogenase [Methanosarcinales archaeon]|nr:MAG: NAD(P)-dependent glycerol-1-phosphate dehydrogenase [Methanosarcinales archaeon]
MQLPREIVVGHGVIEEVGNVCQKLGLHGSAIVVMDDITASIAGNHVCEILAASGYDPVPFVTDSVRRERIDDVNALATEVKASFVIGVGGGTVIDLAKISSAQINKPFLSVPTAAAHDGIASPRASVKEERGSISVAAQSPLGVVADTEIIVKAPPRLLRSGCGDVISNITAVKDWALASKLINAPYSAYAAALAEMTAKMIIESSDQIKPNFEESVRLVVKALISGGVAMSIAGSSAPASGSEHKFSHALDKIAPEPALHGEQCGVGTIMMMHLHGGDWKMIRTALQNIGAPVDAEALGIDDKYIIEALTIAHTINPERYTILGTGITADAAERLASFTRVIKRKGSDKNGYRD